MSARNTFAAISIFPIVYISGWQISDQKLNSSQGTRSPSNTSSTGCQYQNQPSPTEKMMLGTPSAQMRRSKVTFQPGW